MKKQFILGLCSLSVVSCTSLGNNGSGYSTLADMFVWGDSNEIIEDTSRGVKVSYKERLPLQTSNERVVGHSNYQYNDDVDVKYVNVEDADTENNTPADAEGIIIKEVIIETDNPDKNAQTYTLTKRSERYKKIDETFSPNVYAIIASRVANKFLTDLPGIMADVKNPSLYIEETVYGDRYMPSTPDVTTTTIKEIIIGSHMIKVVDDIKDATHILKGRIGNINTPEVPVFKYGISLHDSNNVMIDKWDDTMRQVQNDDGSWW